MRKRSQRLSATPVIHLALKLGALDAKLVHPRNVVTAEWVRLKCQYGCGGYGCCLTCPPYSPAPEQTRRVLDCYTRALLIHGDGKSAGIRRIIIPLEREAFLAGFYKAFAFASGPCNLCPACNTNEICRHGEKARPAMEACGIDVFATARAAGLPIEVVTNHKCGQNYYGLLLLD